MSVFNGAKRGFRLFVSLRKKIVMITGISMQVRLQLGSGLGSVFRVRVRFTVRVSLRVIQLATAVFYFALQL